MPGSGGEIEVRSPNLKAELERVKEFDATLHRITRRRIRDTGKELIGAMKVELDKEPRGKIIGVKKETRVRASKSSGARGGAKFTKRTYITEVRTSGKRSGKGRGAREEIKAGLRVSIMTGKTRSGIRIRGAGTGFARSYNMKRFRHPVFGNKNAYADQAGRPYFGDVIGAHRNQIEQDILAALDDAIDTMNQGGA